MVDSGIFYKSIKGFSREGKGKQSTERGKVQGTLSSGSLSRRRGTAGLNSKAATTGFLEGLASEVAQTAQIHVNRIASDCDTLKERALGRRCFRYSCSPGRRLRFPTTNRSGRSTSSLVRNLHGD